MQCHKHVSRGFARTHSAVRNLVSNKSTILRQLLKKTCSTIKFLDKFEDTYEKKYNKQSSDSCARVFFASPEQFGLMAIQGFARTPTILSCCPYNIKTAT